jgi:putative acetyltransferase
MRLLALIGCVALIASGCSRATRTSSDLPPDRTVVAASQQPVAVDPGRVGSYPAKTKSGGGYFYDDVLEYRVWINPPDGGDDYYRAFASFEPASKFSKSTPGAEQPLVLVRQVKWVNEPKPGQFEPRTDERITEWQVGWLSGNKRSEDSIEKFLLEKGAKK